MTRNNKSSSAAAAGIDAANQLLKKGFPPIDREARKLESLELLERSEIAMVGSVDEHGYPNIKAMFKIESEGLSTVWFSTNTSSRRVLHFIRNPKASVYVHNASRFEGLSLTGEIEVVQDEHSKRELWREGWEVYYPLGVTDPDYSLLKFTAKQGHYYRGLQNVSFEL